MTQRWRDALIPPHATVRDALARIGTSRCHIALVADDSGRLLGTVTDGDIRRALLGTVSLDAPVREVMTRTPITVPPGSDNVACIALMKSRSILQLPVIDGGRIVGLILLEDLVAPAASLRPNWVMLMAGGRGERLRPLTEQLPKPMLPIGGRPLLEIIIEEAARFGLKRFYLSVNYRAEAIIDHFGDGSRFGVEIRYLREDQQMGTAGALSLLRERPADPLLVMNGDLLTKLDFARLLDYHKARGADITVCVRAFDVELPFGVLTVDGESIRSIVEKPVEKFLVNAGIYVLQPSLIDRVPQGRRFDMPDLIREVLADGHAVRGFPIHEYWIDIGRADDLARASNEFVATFKPAQVAG